MRGLFHCVFPARIWKMPAECKDPAKLGRCWNRRYGHNFQMKPSQWISGISYIKIPLIQWLGWILKMVAVERIIEGDLKRWRLAWPRRWFGHNDDIYYVLSEVALTLSGERLKSVTFGHVKDLCFRLPPLHSKWRHHPPILSVSKGPWGLWYL